MTPYYESQRFNQWWMWAILILVAGITIWGSIQQLVFGIPFGNNPAPDGVMGAMNLIPIILIGLFLVMQLRTTLSEHGVEMYFFPFIRKQWAWSEVESYEVKAYSPIADYGGWGFRWNGKTMVYSVGGNHGLELRLKNGKSVLIGTQQPDEMKKWLNQIG